MFYESSKKVKTSLIIFALFSYFLNAFVHFFSYGLKIYHVVIQSFSKIDSEDNLSHYG